MAAQQTQEAKVIQGNLFNTIEAKNSSWRPAAPPSLDGVDEIALDCESDGLRWWRGNRPIGWAVGFKRDGKIITQYLPFAHRGGGNLDEAVVKRWMQREVRGKKIRNLNSRFDNHMAYVWGVDLEEQQNTWSDIAHTMGILNDQRRSGYSLEKISQDTLGVGKVKGLDKSRMAEYHAGDVDEYACTDVDLVLKNWDVLRPQLEARDLLRVQQLEDEVIFAVCEMERNGAPIDTEKLQLWIKKADKEVQECLWKIHKMTGLRVEPKSVDDKIRLFRARGIEIKHFTPTGQPSFTDAILSKHKDEAVVLLRRVLKLKSLDSKYFRNYWDDLRGGNIIRYALNQLRSDEGGTISGRFSSSGMMDDEGINVQQVMRPDKHKEIFGEDYIIRELFTPERGQIWFCTDAKQIEYRLFAHYSGSKRLWEAYAKDPNTDFHNVVWAILKQFDPTITRKLTKDINFAKIYGAGVEKISKMLGVSEDKAQEFVNIYDSQFPETKRLLKKVSRIAENRGYVRTILGRRFYFEEGQFIHKALSRVIQGTAADIMKTKLKELHQARKFTGLKMRFTVHDEVNGDVPDAEAARRVEAILNTQSISFKVPILWDTGIGANWKEAKAA